MLLGKPHTPESELYAFGLVLCHMFTLQEPYANVGSGDDDLALLVAHHDLRPFMTDAVPSPLRTVIQDFWHGNPSRRPTWGEGAATRPVSALRCRMLPAGGGRVSGPAGALVTPCVHAPRQATARCEPL